MVSTRIGTVDGSRLGNFGLNQDWNRGQSILGNFLSQPGLERRLGGIIRVFNLCKGGILPYTGFGIQYSEKWWREIIR